MTLLALLPPIIVGCTTAGALIAWPLDAAINLAQPHREPHRVGKKRAARLLDDRTWDEYPGVVGRG